MTYRKKADLASKIATICTSVLLILTTDILDFANHSFSYAIIKTIIALLINPTIVYLTSNIMISIVKLVYCKINNLKIKTVDLSLILLQFNPFSINLMLNSNFIAGNNLTTFSLKEFNQKELENVYKKYLNAMEDISALIFNPIISNSNEGYDINLLVFLLNYCKNTNTND